MCFSEFKVLTISAVSVAHDKGEVGRERAEKTIFSSLSIVEVTKVCCSFSFAS